MPFLERSLYDSYRRGQQGDEMLTPEPKPARKPARQRGVEASRENKGMEDGEDPERQFKDGDLAALRDIND